ASEFCGFGADQLGGLVGFEGLVADVFALLVDDDNQGDGPRTVIVSAAAILVIENRYMHLVLPDETPDVVLGVELDGDGDGAESVLGQLVRKLLDMREGMLAMRAFGGEIENHELAVREMRKLHVRIRNGLQLQAEVDVFPLAAALVHLECRRGFGGG